ncbi:MAG: GNAT family N-acetyltransferase [Pseudomonadota bacterium]
MDTATLKIRSFEDADTEAFKSLNLAWIEQYFEVETKDFEMLSDPNGSILSKGGRILLAELDGEVVGTVALIPMAKPGVIELAKMAVRDGLRGHGIGEALMVAAKTEALTMDGQKIWIETHNSLEAALKLYQKSGFRPLGADEWSPTPYSRCNAQFLLDLSL